MTFEQFEKAKKGDLRAWAKECFDKAQPGGIFYNTDMQSTAFLEAQFYMQELDRRHDSWTSLRDLILEIVVIALIGGEIWLAWRQGKDEDLLMDKQNQVLTNLATSSSATATTLQSLQGTTETMNTAVHNQLARMSLPQLATFYDPRKGHIALQNMGSYDLQIWGMKIGPQKAGIYSKPILIRAGGNVEISADDLMKQVLARHQKEEAVPVPVELYLSDDVDDEYALYVTYVVIVRNQEVAGVNEQDRSIRLRNWKLENR